MSSHRGQPRQAAPATSRHALSHDTSRRSGVGRPLSAASRAAACHALDAANAPTTAAPRSSGDAITWSANY